MHPYHLTLRITPFCPLNPQPNQRCTHFLSILSAMYPPTPLLKSSLIHLLSSINPFNPFFCPLSLKPNSCCSQFSSNLSVIHPPGRLPKASIIHALSSATPFPFPSCPSRQTEPTTRPFLSSFLYVARLAAKFTLYLVFFHPSAPKVIHYPPTVLHQPPPPHPFLRSFRCSTCGQIHVVVNFRQPFNLAQSQHK